jgi:hypothetical protein
MLETLHNVRKKPGFAGNSNAEIGNPRLFSTDGNTSSSKPRVPFSSSRAGIWLAQSVAIRCNPCALIIGTISLTSARQTASAARFKATGPLSKGHDHAVVTSSWRIERIKLETARGFANRKTAHM